MAVSGGNIGAGRNIIADIADKASELLSQVTADAGNAKGLTDPRQNLTAAVDSKANNVADAKPENPTLFALQEIKGQAKIVHTLI